MTSNILDAEEVSINKTMLTLRPALTKQAILSYFTRPGRDINHARIGEIAAGLTWQWVPPAPVLVTLAYMVTRSSLAYPSATQFLSGGGSAFSAGRTLAILELTCWPVGQGLFMSGRLYGVAGGSFSWVYDCGSSSKKSVLARAVGDFRKQSSGSRIDLVTLSHFDADHINGIETLIRGKSIGTLLLPYLPIWQRLVIALSQGIADGDPLFAFFIDPATYLAERGDIDEIVFVPPAGPDDVVPESDGAPDPDLPIEGAKIEDGEPPEDGGDDPALSDHGAIRVRTLRPGGRIVIPCLWEFIPYNDAKMQPRATPRFQRWASRIASVFVRDATRRRKALRVLKAIYDHAFGGTSTPRNLISLFLYSGPIGTSITLERHGSSHPVRWNAQRDNFAQLSTGDGYLHTLVQLDALRRFYARNRRLERAGVLQVMHHGAEGNWHDGVAKALAPAVSIFSSDPDHTLGHPHAAVLRDFWPYCPVQVDADSPFELSALLALP